MYCKANVSFLNRLSKFCTKSVRIVKRTKTNTFTCKLCAWVIFIILFTGAVSHLPQIPGNSGWGVNGKRFFGSSHWKIPGQTEILKRWSRFPDWDVPNRNSFTIYPGYWYSWHGNKVHTYIHTLLARPHGAFQSQLKVWGSALAWDKPKARRK